MMITKDWRSRWLLEQPPHEAFDEREIVFRAFASGDDVRGADKARTLRGARRNRR